jgi:hypothetical protein
MEQLAREALAECSEALAGLRQMLRLLPKGRTRSQHGGG